MSYYNYFFRINVPGSMNVNAVKLKIIITYVSNDIDFTCVESLVVLPKTKQVSWLQSSQRKSETASAMRTGPCMMLNLKSMVRCDFVWFIAWVA